MYPPIIDAMLNRHSMPVVNKDSVDEFLQQNALAVLFFAEDPMKYPETADVAMVLPELVREFPGLAPALVDFDDQHALQKNFDFTAWPALAFFRDGAYRGAITRIQNWQDYLVQIDELLNKAPKLMIPAVNVE